MVKRTVKKRKRAGHIRETASRTVKEGIETVEDLMPPGSPQRTAASVGAAAVGALVAAAWLGVGPVALAGVAGYLAYRASGRK